MHQPVVFKFPRKKEHIGAHEPSQEMLPQKYIVFSLQPEDEIYSTIQPPKNRVLVKAESTGRS